MESTRDELVQYLESVARPDQVFDEIGDKTNLIDAGLLDSFALIQIVLYLEEEHDIDLRAGGIEITELSTIAGILNAIERARP